MRITAPFPGERNQRRTLPLVALLSLVLLPSLGRAESAPALELLFEGNFVAEAGIASYVEADDPFDRSFRMKRDLIAQGEGKVAGALLRGTVRWSLLGRTVPGTDYGRIHLSGWLETPGGAEIFFTATGFGLGESHSVTRSTALIATGRFEAELEPGYAWLNSTISLWRGRFDPESQSLSFEIWAPVESIAAALPTDVR